jgi:hypothetical protein
MPDPLTYTSDQGEIEFDQPTDVIIAGKVRKRIVWLYPGIVKGYELADRTLKLGYGT